MGGDQLTFQTMGGETVAVKARGKHYVEPRGGADRPGTGPAGETWTHGPKTDIRMRWPVCGKWESNIPSQADAPFHCPPDDAA
jgi:hypothetical protein